MKRNKQMTPANIRTPLLICIIVGIFMLALYTVLTSLTDFSPLIVGVVLTVLYVYVFVFGIIAVNKTLRRMEDERRSADAFNTEISQMFREVIDLPYAVVAEDGTITVANSALEHLVGSQLGGGRLEDFCSTTIERIIEASNTPEPEDKNAPREANEGLTISIRRRKFNAKSYPIAVRGNKSNMVVFSEVTALVKLYDKMQRENTVVALIVLDNLEELAQYVRVSYRAAANEIENILKTWSNSMNGILREYDRDKYILMISYEKLEECVKNKFSILDAVRDVRLGEDNMSVTVSMGISAGTGSLLERETEASEALELALQRGGDQVALRRGRDTEYFGGKSKSIQKRTRVRSRVNANVLCAKISESSNVLVMGHKNPDFDCIGACIGIARLAMFCGTPVKIVSDLRSENFAIVASRFTKYDEYRDMFVDAQGGLDFVRSDTLLIICDANNFNIIEAPDIANNVDRIAIIDHHRQTMKFNFDPLVSYIDPASSSASELVSEVLEQCLPSGGMLKDEANALLAGIMLDTKNFSKATGTRTFAAALFLQNSGARPETARAFFEEDIDAFLAEAKFSNDIEMYHGNIAITRSNGTGNPEQDRVAASKMADKLLTVRQVDAAFALVQNENDIKISARSTGNINVQLILEQLGGGGHFDSAGAAVEGAMEKAHDLLISAVDKYLNQMAKR